LHLSCHYGAGGDQLLVQTAVAPSVTPHTVQ
jgi:hypothetical protein